MPQSPPLRAVRVPAAAWAAACEAALGRPTVPSPAWAAAGWATPDGGLDDAWRTLIGEHLTAALVFGVVAEYRDLVHVAEVCLGTDVTTSLVTRYRVRPDEAGGTRLAGADPDVEFAVAAGEAAWPLVRRALPPQDEFRAAPRRTPDDATPPLATTDPAALARALADDGRPVLASAALAGIVGPVAGVTVTTVVRPPEREAVGVGRRAWVLGEGGLFRVGSTDERATVERVAPGDLGFHVSWQVLGALDTLTGASGSRP